MTKVYLAVEYYKEETGTTLTSVPFEYESKDAVIKYIETRPYNIGKKIVEINRDPMQFGKPDILITLEGVEDGDTTTMRFYHIFYEKNDTLNKKDPTRWR